MAARAGDGVAPLPFVTSTGPSGPVSYSERPPEVLHGPARRTPADPGLQQRSAIARDRLPGSSSKLRVGDWLLAPHRSYLGPLAPLLAEPGLHALAHITGGGLTDNLPRVLPEGVGVVPRAVLLVRQRVQGSLGLGTERVYFSLRSQANH